MKNYRVVHAFVHAGIATLLYLFLTYSDLLASYAYANYIRAAILIVLPFLFVRSNAISDMLVEKVPGVSVAIRKIFSGSDFVEGDWPLVVVDADGVTPKYFGFLTIAYRGGQLTVAGDDWNPDGSPAVKFRSQQSQYEGRILQYWYAQGATLHAPAMFGYTRIYFFPETGRVERHAGEFLDKEHLSQRFLRQADVLRRARQAAEGQRGEVRGGEGVLAGDRRKFRKDALPRVDQDFD